jgi:hypothetical protein
MKNVFSFLPRFVLLFVLLVGIVLHTDAQKSKKGVDSAQAAAIEKLLQEQQFEFKATHVTPMKGGMRTLTPGYFLKVAKDTIISDLPYIGRSYQSGYGADEGGIKVHASQYEYKKEKGKKDGWTVQIMPLNIPNPPAFLLTVYTNGSATLQVTSYNKQAIMFKGEIVPLK